MRFRDILKTIMTPWDKVLIVFLLIVSFSSYVAIRTFFPYNTDKIALIEINGKEVMRLSLNPDIPPRERRLKLAEGDAVIDISHGKIRILPMEDRLCPNHICSKTGWIDKPWQMIVCLPNKISVRIVGRKKDGDVDLITK